MTDNLRRTAMTAILRNAVLSWQTLVTLIVTGILFLFVDVSDVIPFFQSWMWLVLGGLAEVAFIGATLTDPAEAERAVSQQFETRYDLSRIKSRVSRDRLKSALEYRRNMLELSQRAGGAMRSQLSGTVDDVNDWIGHMYNLALHIDAFEENELVERDRRSVPQQLDKTRQRMERETDPDVRRELERQVNQLEQQRTNLEATVNSVKRAEIQLESTLASLGTVYAQMARMGAKEVDSGRAQRLRLEIQDEISSLQDTLEAMDEVQAQSLRLQ